MRYATRKVEMAKRRVTMRVDRAKLKAAKQILGTKTITATVDSALDEILKQRSDRLKAARTRLSPAACATYDSKP